MNALTLARARHEWDIGARKVIFAWHQVAIVNDEPVCQKSRCLVGSPIDTRPPIELGTIDRVLGYDALECEAS